jgi:colanic acid biosynthesis protein WcaH
LEAAVHELVEDDFASRDVPEFGMTEPDYGHALDHLVQANVDTIVHTADRRVLLGYRKDPPLRDMFWVFGGRMKRGETVAGTAVRALRRELGLAAEPGRFAVDQVYNVRWGRRSAPPEERGFQTLLTLMRYECTGDEARELSAADRTHEWLRWHTAAELRALHAAGSPLIHPFLPVILRNAGLLGEAP